MTRQKANILPVTDHVRKLLSSMNFPPIPEEVKAIAFFENGGAQFISEFTIPFKAGIGEMFLLTYYPDLEIDIE